MCVCQLAGRGREFAGGQGQGTPSAADASPRQTLCRFQQSDGVLDARADLGGREQGMYGEQQLISRLMHCQLYTGSCTYTHAMLRGGGLVRLKTAEDRGGDGRDSDMKTGGLRLGTGGVHGDKVEGVQMANTAWAQRLQTERLRG